ncbi:MAG: alcohol dehydrogenase catalytic domain-containing protein [Oscillospiraceae bacterium]|jgi:threonine dehydrogenase-like Zn-dependent dehydrogenase|nr:alcohol dehydrogenase catalytic domain-containing protein [Oscillospiraceae bacterium]
MVTTAVRLYGKRDLRLETFELPPVGDDEILAEVISDSVCMSTYKAAEQGAAHKRVPDDPARNPVIIGHEFCGRILETGGKWRGAFSPGDRFAIQPAVNDPANIYAAPGYSFSYIGGAATYIIIPGIFMERGCLLPYDGAAYYQGSLAEPVSCVIGGFRCMYHTRAGSYLHEMGIKPGGKMALLAGAGPMGLGAIDYALHGDRRPSLLAVTDIDGARLDRAAALYTPGHAKSCGVELVYRNAPDTGELTELSGGTGFDDVFIYAPVASLCEQGGAVLARDGCLNFFAGPPDPDFSARMNFYGLHYNAHHVACNSGGNADDMRRSLEMVSQGAIDPSVMVTHIGGLDAVIETTLNLPGIPGGKKLMYTHLSMPLTAIADFAELGAADPLFAQLAERTKNGLWTPECERYLLENGQPLSL